MKEKWLLNMYNTYFGREFELVKDDRYVYRKQ